MLLPVDVGVMVVMRRRAVADAAKKFFSSFRAGGREVSGVVSKDLGDMRVMVEMRKASFGGNRSEAGRYAANVRWQGESVEDPSRKSDVARAKLVEAGTKLRKALGADRGAYLGRAKESLRLRGVEEEITGEVEQFFDDTREETLKAFVKAEANISASLNGLDSDENFRSTRYETEIKKAQTAFVALANKFEKELRKIDPNAFINPDNPFGMEAKRSKNFFPVRYPRSLKGSILSVFDGTIRLIATDLEQVAKDIYAVEKASFGGNRSEAGRYAANVRWQGQTVDSPSKAGYSDVVGEKQKSELNILAVKTDTRLAELFTEIGILERQQFFYITNLMDKAKLLEKAPRANTRSALAYNEQQKRLAFQKFKNMTPEEQQKVLEEAQKNAQSYEQNSLQTTIKSLTESEQKLLPLKTEQESLENIFREKGWQRFFLVTNTNGHVHRSMNCSTTFPTTDWKWLPNLSGLTDKEAVDDQGGILCTHCFPDAPSDYTSGESRAKREGREARAEEKRVRDQIKLGKKLTADGSDVRLENGKTETNSATGRVYLRTETISSLTGAKEFLRDAMQYKSPRTRVEFRDGFDGFHTDQNVALIAKLLSEKTGDPIEEILEDARKRAVKRYLN